MGVGGQRKGLAIVAMFLFLMGVVVPAAFGWLTVKAMELGIGDLVDKSTNWDSSNIANSTYFIKEKAYYVDVGTGNTYSLSPVYDDSTDLDLVMATTDEVAASASSTKDSIDYYVYFNGTMLQKVDKITVLVSIVDPAGVDFGSSTFKIALYSDGSPIWAVYKNASTAVNSTLKIEIAIDAVKRLKLSGAVEPFVFVSLRAPDNSTRLQNVVVGYRIELYEVKKVDTSAASNIMLTVSGILGWVGALAATPYWNPLSNPSHRNIRRIRRRRR